MWLVEFASLADPALVPQKVAATLDLREQPDQPLLATLADYLRDKNLLLVLDNCEHLIVACAQLAESLLQACPHVTILATSREALNIAGETIFLVPSLSSPHPEDASSLDKMTQYEAVQLFVARAAAQSRFALTKENAPAVARICHQLDGIPLAIELAAARVKALSVEQIAARLDDSIHLLTGGSRTALPRHQTLRAALDWSYALLSEPERVLFRRLSVFAGGWTLEAAEAVCAGDGGVGLAPTPGGQLQVLPLPQSDVLDLLTQLVNKSLVLLEEKDGESRYRLLEPIRQYAREKLTEANEEAHARGRHLDFFTKLAQESFGVEQVIWFHRLETEHDNLRVALGWATEHDIATALHLAVALWPLWFTRGYHREGLEHLKRILARPDAAARTALRGNALEIAGSLASLQHDYYTSARSLLEEALAIGRELGDKKLTGIVLIDLGILASEQGDYAAARPFHEENLMIQKELRDKELTAISLHRLGEIALYEGANEGAQRLYEESLSLFEQLPPHSQTYRTSFVYRRMGELALRQGDYPKAIELCRQSLTLNKQLQDNIGIIASIAALAAVDAARGQTIPSARLLGAVETLLESFRVQLQFFDQDQYRRNVAAIRAQLREATFAKAWAEGRAMTLEQAIAEAERMTVMEEADLSTQTQTPTPTYPAGLTEREVEVLRWLTKGLTDAEIAEQLVVSVRTVHAHLRSIYGKLDVTTRSAATRAAIDLKLD